MPVKYQELLKRESGDPFLCLATLRIEDDLFRFVNNITDIHSRGETYKAFNFELVLPLDDGNTDSNFEIVLDNVGQELMRAIRKQNGHPQLTLEIIFASDPDNVQFTFPELKVTNFRYDLFTVRGNLVYDTGMNLEVPGERYTIRNFPGIFFS